MNIKNEASEVDDPEDEDGLKSSRFLEFAIGRPDWARD